MIKNSVKRAKIPACITAINTSNAINGNGNRYGTKNISTIIKRCPAKMLPKSRNERETKRARLPIISSMPIKKSMGDLKLMNLPAYLKKPKYTMPEISIVKNEMIARASGMFRSALMG